MIITDITECLLTYLMIEADIAVIQHHWNVLLFPSHF